MSPDAVAKREQAMFAASRIRDTLIALRDSDAYVRPMEDPSVEVLVQKVEHCARALRQQLPKWQYRLEMNRSIGRVEAMLHTLSIVRSDEGFQIAASMFKQYFPAA